MKTQHDWSRLDAMTEEQRRAAALADPDAQPLSDADMDRMKPTSRLKIIRRALGLTQEQFAGRYQIRSERCAIGSRGPSSRTRRRVPIFARLPAIPSASSVRSTRPSGRRCDPLNIGPSPANDGRSVTSETRVLKRHRNPRNRRETIHR